MSVIITDRELLRRPSLPVKNTREGGEIARYLTATLRRHNKRVRNKTARDMRAIKGLDPVPKLGIGLSAPQLGIFKQVAVILIGDVPKVLMNPVLVDKSETLIDFEEGCLSLPGLTVKTKRHLRATYMTLNYGLVTFGVTDPEKFSGRNLLECVTAQHEEEHLRGLLITRFLGKPC